MTRIIYTSYHTNSFKIIKSTFSIYEFPQESVIFLINLGILNCFENSGRAENFRQTVLIYGWWGGGGGGGGGGGVCPPPPPAPPDFPPLGYGTIRLNWKTAFMNKLK